MTTGLGGDCLLGLPCTTVVWCAVLLSAVSLSLSWSPPWGVEHVRLSHMTLTTDQTYRSVGVATVQCRDGGGVG